MQFNPYVYSFSAYNVAYPSVFFHKKDTTAIIPSYPFDNFH